MACDLDTRLPETTGVRRASIIDPCEFSQERGNATLERATLSLATAPSLRCIDSHTSYLFRLAGKLGRSEPLIGSGLFLLERSNIPYAQGPTSMIYIATIREYDVDPTGVIVDRSASTTSIKTMLTTNKEWRVVPDTNNSNTSGHPTIQEYLALEGADAHEFAGMIGAYMIATQDTDSVAAGSTALNESENGTVTVQDGVSTLALASNTARRLAIINNQGGASVFVSFGSDAVITDLEIADGQSFTLDFNDGHIFVGDVNAIASGADVDITVVEFEAP